jgi:hypothetical protein
MCLWWGLSSWSVSLGRVGYHTLYWQQQVCWHEMHYHIIGWEFPQAGATVYCEVGLCTRKQNLKASKISPSQQIVLLIPEFIPPYAFMVLSLIS